MKMIEKPPHTCPSIEELTLGLIILLSEWFDKLSSSRMALAFLARTPQKPPASVELLIEALS